MHERARNVCTSAQAAGPEVDDLVVKATTALAKARAALKKQQKAEEAKESAPADTPNGSTTAPSFIPASLTFGMPLSTQNSDTAASRAPAPTAIELPDALPADGEAPDAPRPPPDKSGGRAEWGDSQASAPTMQLQRSRTRPRAALSFAEPHPTTELELKSQVGHPSVANTVLLFAENLQSELRAEALRPTAARAGTQRHPQPCHARESDSVCTDCRRRWKRQQQSYRRCSRSWS